MAFRDVFDLLLPFLYFPAISLPLISTTAANVTLLLVDNAVKHISFRKSDSSNYLTCTFIDNINDMKKVNVIKTKTIVSV